MQCPHKTATDGIHLVSEVDYWFLSEYLNLIKYDLISVETHTIAFENNLCFHPKDVRLEYNNKYDVTFCQKWISYSYT